MAKEKPKNGRRTNKAKEYKPTGRPGVGGITGTYQAPTGPPVQPTRDPKLWKKVKDPAGFWKWEKRKTGAKALPPSVRAKREEMAKQPPPVKYASKEPKRKTKYKQPKVQPFQPRSTPKKKGGVS